MLSEPNLVYNLKVMPVKKTFKNQKSTDPQATKTRRIKRVCAFCQSNTEPLYTDSAALKRLLSDRNRIIPRARTGVCSKHQRSVAREIKHARHLSLLPFVAAV